MNVNKHMEAIFLTTLAVVGAGSFAVERLPDAAAQTQAQMQMQMQTPAQTRAAMRAALPAENNVGTPGHMAVIVVRGHRPARGA